MTSDLLTTALVLKRNVLKSAFRRTQYLALGIIAHLSTLSLVYAQTSVGNGSSIAPAAGQQGNYGINSPAQSGVEYRTRHFRRRDNTGIGSSFIGTTSPTSEGSPALRPTSSTAMPTSDMQFRLPKLESIFPESNLNPALDSFSASPPHLPSSSALSSPTMNVSSFKRDFADSTQQEIVPSFSRTPSFSDKMQFNSFDASENFSK